MLLFAYFQQDNNNVKFCFHLTSNFLLFFKKKGNIYIYIYVCIYTNANYRNITKQKFIMHFHKSNLAKRNYDIFQLTHITIYNPKFIYNGKKQQYTYKQQKQKRNIQKIQNKTKLTPSTTAHPPSPTHTHHPTLFISVSCQTSKVESHVNKTQ